jgi:hypothetical protein
MTDVRDPALLIEAAQKAVAHGHYPEAERLLREAAAIQEATLGGSHPDLATTLNNLAYVCEQAGNIDEAERGYRRAHKIAVASLSPGHPFIKTSLSNLMEFCEARGIPIWTRPERPVEDEPLPDEIDVDTARDDDRVADDAGTEPRHAEAPAIVIPPAMIHEPVAARRLPLRMMAAAALVILAIVVIAFSRRGQEATDEPLPLAYASTMTVPSTPVPPAPAATVPSEGPAPVPPRAPEPPTAPPNLRAADGNATASVTVLKAQLCTTLAKRGSPDWDCASAGGDGPPGRYTFYTRLLTTAATTVQHRWYFRGRVHQTMRLRVAANPRSGYRTFSATTVSPERAGDWMVQLRAADGTVLDEKRFRVR